MTGSTGPDHRPSVRSTRLAARIARREAARRPWRSLLVIVLIAIPVAGMTAATAVFATAARTPEVRFDEQVGSAYDLRFGVTADWTPAGAPAGTAPSDATGSTPAATIDDIEAILPAGSQTTVIRSTQLRLRTDTARSFTAAVTADPDPRVQLARRPLLSGTFPSSADAGSIAVSRALADTFDVDAGDTLALVRPDVTVRVTGVYDIPSCLGCDEITVTDVDQPILATALYASTALHVRLPAAITDGDGPIRLLTTDDARLVDAIAGLGDGSFSVLVRPSLFTRLPAELTASVYDQFGSDDTSAVGWSIVVGAVVLAVVGIVIASAFAVSARTQLALLGQLSANGATESTRRAVLTLQGTVAGFIGSIAGIVLGAVGLIVAEGQVETMLDRRVDGFTWSPVVLVIIAVVGTLGATLAARFPARTAARFPTLAALAGRRPQTAVPRSLAPRGIAAFVAGTAVLSVIAGAEFDAGQSTTPVTLVAIASGLAVLFGATATTPALVALVEPLAERTRGAVRIAIRSLARNRGRSGAIIAAVAAAGALAVGGVTVSRSTDTPANETDGIEFSQATPGLVTLAVRTVTDVSPDATSGDIPPSGAFAGEVVFDTLTPPPATMVDAVVDAFPGATATTLGQVPMTLDDGSAESSDPGLGTPALVLAADDARAFRLDDTVAATLERDGIVVVQTASETFGDTVGVVLGDGVRRVVTGVFSPFTLTYNPTVYVTPEFVATHGLTAEEGPVVIRDPDGVIDEFEAFDIDEQSEIFYRSVGDTGERPTPGRPGFVTNTYRNLDTAYTVGDGSPTGLEREPIEAILAAVAIIIALVVLAIGLALTAADARDERTTLTVVGARPSMLASATAGRAWIMATLGFLLAVPLGYIPVAAVASAARPNSANNGPFPLTTVLILVLVAPAVAWLLTRAVAGAAGRIRPVAISTAIFD